MKALIKEKPVKGATFTELPTPQIRNDDLLVQVKAAGICGSDIHIYKWSEFASSRINLPLLFGHEYSGEVVEVGKSVTNFSAGDRVAAEPHVPCGHCFQCTTGLQHICENMQILGVHRDGGFAEYAVLPAVCAWKLNPAISFDIGATMEPFGIGVHAMSKVKPAGKTVVVHGCGPIGIYTQMVAKLSGARMVIATDISPARLELAERMGADVGLNAGQIDVVREVRRLTNGAGADIVVELTGNRSVVNVAADNLRRGGELILIGVFDGPVEINLVDNIIYKEATIYGMTGRVMWDNWWSAQNMLLSGNIDTSPVITDRFKLDDFEKAFELAETAAGGKIVFEI